ncbi:MAG: glycosyltransferase family 2 protein [Vitreimonas sp.]
MAGSDRNDDKRLLVVIPCLNEETHLPVLLSWLSARREPHRIVVADGGSTDASRQIVEGAVKVDPRITLLDNPQRLQSAGVNAAVKAFGAETDRFVRIDAHAGYPDDFLSMLSDAQAESGADSVTISMRAVAASGHCFQRAAACAQNSVLGAGGSRHRKGGARQWVDHGHHALFKTSAFLAAGGYDESFSHNEDAELDARLTARGGRILLAGDILISYFPRTTARALARQYYNFGRGRARTALKHGLPLKARQWAPVLIPPLALLSLLAAPLTPIAAAPLVAWIGGSLAYGVVLGLRERSICGYAAGSAAMVMHAAWSAGFLKQTLFGTPWGALGKIGAQRSA